MPTEIVPGADGRPEKTVSHFSPDTSMDDFATITEWQPPHRFAASAESLGPGAPPVATEWVVEAKSGGTCMVRVVHSLFTDSSDWDDQLQMWEWGWPDFFKILRLKLTHSAGQPFAAAQLMGVVDGTKEEAWAVVSKALAIEDAKLGDHRSSAAGAPPLAGIVEAAGPPEFPETVLLRLDWPAPGIAHFFALQMDRLYLTARLYFYGKDAEAALAQNKPPREAWLGKRCAAWGGRSPVV